MLIGRVTAGRLVAGCGVDRPRLCLASLALSSGSLAGLIWFWPAAAEQCGRWRNACGEGKRNREVRFMRAWCSLTSRIAVACTHQNQKQSVDRLIVMGCLRGILSCTGKTEKINHRDAVIWNCASWLPSTKGMHQFTAVWGRIRLFLDHLSCPSSSLQIFFPHASKKHRSKEDELFFKVCSVFYVFRFHATKRRALLLWAVAQMG